MMTEQELAALEAKVMVYGPLPQMDAAKLIAEIRRLQNAHVACPACGSDWDLNQPDTFHTQLVDERNLLKKQIADAHVIYGVQITAMGETWIDWDNGFPPDVEIVGENRSGIPTATHTARLVDIKKIGEGE